MTLPVLSFDGNVQAVAGPGTFLDLMDAIFTLVDGVGTGVRVTNSVGGAGAREMIEVAMPVASAIPDMRIMFAGKAGVHTPVMKAPDNWLASSLLVSIAPGLGGAEAITGLWDTNQNGPYGAGVKWSGYVLASAAVANFAEVIIHDSDETFFLGIRTAINTYYGCYVGPMIDPVFAANGESDGRLYGIKNSGSNVIGTGWAQNNDQWMDHAAINGNAHCHVFLPGTSTFEPVEKTTEFSAAFFDDCESSPDQIYEPLFYARRSTHKKMGFLRDTFVGQGQWRQKKQVAAVDTFYVFGPDNAADQDALIFRI